MSLKVSITARSEKEPRFVLDIHPIRRRLLGATIRLALKATDLCDYTLEVAESDGHRRIVIDNYGGRLSPRRMAALVHAFAKKAPFVGERWDEREAKP